MLSMDVAAYLAGLVDGEGSIQINPSTRGKSKYWVLTIQISSSAEGYLQSLRDTTLGFGSITSWQPKRKDSRRSWNWRFYGAEAEAVLEDISPYLRLKKPQAELALRFRREGCGFRGNRRRLMPQSLLALRREIALEMRDLNSHTKKGASGKGVVSPNHFSDVR